MLFDAFLVAIGAVCGALLRWSFGLWLNPLFPMFPLGLLAANLLGGLLMGVMIGMTEHSLLAEMTRLAFVIGFLGSLTTFSAFTGELSLLLIRHQYMLCFITMGSHVVGSIALCLFGIFLGKTICC